MRGRLIDLKRTEAGSIFTLRPWERKYGQRHSPPATQSTLHQGGDWTNTCRATPAPDGAIVVTNGEDEREKEGEGMGEKSRVCVCWLTYGQRGDIHWSAGQKKSLLPWSAEVYLRFRIPVHSHPELFHHLTHHDLQMMPPAVLVCTDCCRGQRPINVLQEVDTDLISRQVIISGLTRQWFVQGPKVAVVVSVFNTLNTIDCGVWGMFWRMLVLDWTARH